MCVLLGGTRSEGSSCLPLVSTRPKQEMGMMRQGTEGKGETKERVVLWNEDQNGQSISPSR